jgi:hypothetical protein
MPTTARDMLEAIDSCVRADDEFELSEWEEKFVIDLHAKVRNGVTLTPRQVERLESIYDRT